jgi:hypothetical protein
MCEAIATAGTLDAWVAATGTAETASEDAAVPRARIRGMTMRRLIPMIHSSMASAEFSGLADSLVGPHGTSESSGVIAGLRLFHSLD